MISNFERERVEKSDNVEDLKEYFECLATRYNLLLIKNIGRGEKIRELKKRRALDTCQECGCNEFLCGHNKRD